LAALAWLLLAAEMGQARAPTFQDLMDPNMFAQPQRGMVVHGAALNDRTWQVTTTGARIKADLRQGEVQFDQRIGRQRPVVQLRLGTPLRGGRMTHRGPGLARITFSHPRITIRVNGDSLFMLHAHEPLTVALHRRIVPAWFASHRNNRLVVDEWGGFGLYCSDKAVEDEFDPYAETVARYRLPAGSVLWVGVCPPKPYPWKRSLRDNIVWHHSQQLAYPSDDVLRSWRPHGNIVLLQSEIMLWKGWNLDFVPRLGPQEFARVRKTLHDLGMRFIVYASPAYFLKGTALEPRAIHTYENFTDYPPPTLTGENMDLFMAAITRLMKEQRPDGLYFDGQYIESPAALYALARRARALLGEDGLLEWHSTYALGSKQCYLPQADAYVDYILRGEGAAGQYSSYDYMRFFVSGYNVNNCIGVICNNDGTLNPQLARLVLETNARFHTIASWLDRPDFMEILRRDYRPYLTPALKGRVEAAVNRRQAQVPALAAKHMAQMAERAASYHVESAALKAPPGWGNPRFSPAFDALPNAARVASSQSPEPFRASGGTLTIRGRANTYAFLSFPLQGDARGLVAKIRHKTDGGMSWGPAVMLRFAHGAFVRIGTRADGMLQADITAEQLPGGLPAKVGLRNTPLEDASPEQLLASGYDPQKWVWLRARWADHWGVIERSDDGKAYQAVWCFEHGGRLTGEAVELMIGKVPYNGRAADFTDPGPEGECEIGLVQVY
jgi:hypothetical protein